MRKLSIDFYDFSRFPLIEYSTINNKNTNKDTETAQPYLEAEMYPATFDKKEKILQKLLKQSEVFM